jgi:hypothetical protein
MGTRRYPVSRSTVTGQRFGLQVPAKQAGMKPPAMPLLPQLIPISIWESHVSLDIARR